MTLFKFFVPLMIAFGLTISLMPILIGYFHLKGKGQRVATNLKQHIQKSGTPTMGGIIFVLCASLTCLISSLALNLLTPSLIAILLVLISYAILGFLDDFLKMIKPTNEKGVNEGITDLQKFITQVILGIICFIILAQNNFSLTLNLFGLVQLNLGWFYVLFLVFWLTGFSNAVNLTDGIDGLVAILGTISLATYGIIAYRQRQFDVLLAIICLIGGLVGFSLFNFKPAKIFMGDVGSLALGATLAIISILLHQEWTMLFVGIIYVLETSSVMLQVAFYKLTHGKRIFRMTPIHHHFELGGVTGQGTSWSEWKIDFVFALIAVAFSVVTLLLV